MAEDELHADSSGADYDAWYALSYVPGGFGLPCRPRLVHAMSGGLLALFPTPISVETSVGVHEIHRLKARQLTAALVAAAPLLEHAALVKSAASTDVHEVQQALAELFQRTGATLYFRHHRSGRGYRCGWWRRWGGQGGGVRIINVLDPNLVIGAMSSATGERVIVNTIGKNRQAVRQRLACPSTPDTRGRKQYIRYSMKYIFE
ncbi:MAG: hypothetical protein Q8M09_13115 [Pseudomonadota bacterium]|nr:hypothetical protein [Pseudomonadota bacterium]